MTENILPHDWYLKLQEEIFEVMEVIADGIDDIGDECIAEEIAVNVLRE